jgi:hypothetical protein
MGKNRQTADYAPYVTVEAGDISPARRKDGKKILK